jgi:hypothetical protein
MKALSMVGRLQPGIFATYAVEFADFVLNSLIPGDMARCVWAWA